MTRAHEPAEIDAALARIAAGESQAKVARSLGLHPSTIRLWRRRAAARVSPAPVATPATPPELQPAIAPSPDPAGATDAQLAAGSVAAPDLVMEALASARGDDAAASASKTSTSPSNSPLEAVPTMTGEQCIDATEALHGLVVTLIVGMNGIDLTAEEFERFSTFSGRARKGLRAFAPYAARYAPTLLGQADKVFAALFVVFWGCEIAAAWKAIGKLAESRKPATPAAEADAEKPAGSGFAIPNAQA